MQAIGSGVNVQDQIASTLSNETRGRDGIRKQARNNLDKSNVYTIHSRNNWGLKIAWDT